MLGARGLPIDLVLYDNARERAKSIANAEDAVRRKVDLYIQYCDDQAANEEVARRLAAARIPVLAVNAPVGNAPVYAADNHEAGRLAGDALGRFALTTWRERLLAAAILGAVQTIPRKPSKLASPGSPKACAGILRMWCRSVRQRWQLSRRASAAATLPGQGKWRESLWWLRFDDDATALAAKLAAETAGRVPDTVIVSQGCDPSVHGGTSAKKAIDANNSNSIVLGSVAYFLDRYGSEILPLALKMLQGEHVPPRSLTGHVLVTAKNVFQELLIPRST